VHKYTTVILIELFFYFLQHWLHISWVLSNNHHIIKYDCKLRKFEFFKLAGINNALNDECSELDQLYTVSRLYSF